MGNQKNHKKQISNTNANQQFTKDTVTNSSQQWPTASAAHPALIPDKKDGCPWAQLFKYDLS